MPIALLAALIVTGCSDGNSGAGPDMVDLGVLVADESNAAPAPGAGPTVADGVGDGVVPGGSARSSAVRGDGDHGSVIVSGDPQTGRTPTAARLAELQPAIRDWASKNYAGARVVGIDVGVEHDSWSGAVVRLSIGGDITSLTVTLARHEGEWTVVGATVVGRGSR